MKRCYAHAAWILIISFLIPYMAAAQGIEVLASDSCVNKSSLPQTYQLWQGQPRWMGIACAPLNSIQSLYLEIRSGSDPSSLGSYNPPVISTKPFSTNFLVKNFAGQPAGYVFPRTYTSAPINMGHVVDWSPGQGIMTPGTTGATMSYGGTGPDCGLIQVFTVFMEAGKNYRFYLEKSTPQDDIKMALLRTSSLPDGWVARIDAFWEKPADPWGGGIPLAYTTDTTANYALVVFLDDIAAAGGQYTVSYQEHIPNPNLPDLIITGIDPLIFVQAANFHVTVHIKNQGGVDSGWFTSGFTQDGIHVSSQPEIVNIPAGGTFDLPVSIDRLGIGTHTLHGQVDIFSTVAEGEEYNNEFNTTYTVLVPNGPDLVVAGTNPLSVLPLIPNTVDIFIRNNGDQLAQQSTTRYVIDGGAQTLDIATPWLNPGQQTTVSGVLSALREGPHSDDITADINSVSGDSNPLNNTISTTLNAEGVNLIIDSFTPLVFSDASPMTFDVVVHNIGTLTSPITSTILTLTADGTSGWAETPAIPGGGTTMVQITMNPPVAPGPNAVEICADYTFIINEIDETDNCLPGSVTITPTLLIWPDTQAIYPTLQAAIDGIAPGGLIRIKAGTYTGTGNRDLDFHGKDLTLIAFGNGEVIIDCQAGPGNDHRAFRFSSGETSAAVVDGLTITGGFQEFGSGGGILIGNAQPTIRNCLIRNCHAFNGGAVAFSSIYNYYHPYIIGCTLAGNFGVFGGAVFAYGEIAPFLQNTLIASNSGSNGAVALDPGIYAGPQLGISCSDIWGNGGGDWSPFLTGQLGINNNISQNPLFCAPLTNDYQLASNSPCDAAINTCGQIGALASGCGPIGGTIRQVRADGTGSYVTIQHAINNCVDGDIVELLDGTYIGTGNWDVSTIGLGIIVRSASSNPYACVIDGQNAHRGFNFNSGEILSTVISGIGIINGQAADGGGINCDGASPVLDNLHISGCQSTNSGGAINLANLAAPGISGCVIENNIAANDGGGLYAILSSPHLMGSIFLNNTSADWGGGAIFNGNCTPIIDDCWFDGNSALNGGGLVLVNSSAPVNRTFIVNNTATFGGGIYIWGGSGIFFDQCDIVGNTATNGSGFYLRATASPQIDRSIIAFGISGSALVRFATDCNPTLLCSDLWGNAGGDWTAMISAQAGINGNRWDDPLFCNRVGGNLTLRGDSPCAEVNNTSCGQIGTLGVSCSGSWLVKPDGSGDFATIQEAIDAAVTGESVVLADGIFTGVGNRDLSFRGKAITMRSQSGDSTACIIDCQGTQATPHYGINFNSGETNSSVLERITIRNAWRFSGGGGRIDAASPVLRGMIFEFNGADSGAALIMANGATPSLEDCIFRNNISDNAGGGIYINASYPQITRCLFQDNSAVWGGGGLYNQHASPNLNGCIFNGNKSGHWGGGIHNRYIESSPNLVDCIFLGNSATQGGAVYSRDGSTPTFSTSTFYGNSSSDGAIFYAKGSSSLTLIRNIMVFSPLGAAATSDGTAIFNLICCDVFANAGGDYTGPLSGMSGLDNNFSSDPIFCDMYNSNLTLGSASPCLPIRSSCGLLIGALDEGCAVSSVKDPGSGIPDRLSLLLNVPNPFNPITTIHYQLPSAGQVLVDIFDSAGRRIARLVQEYQEAGRRQVIWYARDDQNRSVASGLYFVRLKHASGTRVQKILLTK